jgi:hypothetical protein
MLFQFQHVSKKKPVQMPKSSTPREYILRDLHFTINILQLIIN